MRSTFKLVSLICTVILFTLLLGCMKGEQTSSDVNVSEEVELVDELPSDDEAESVAEEIENQSGETVIRSLYLIDANGMVVPQQLELPKIESKEVATQVLQYLVKGGPVTSILPNGFQAVLPEDTEILSLNLKDDGTLIVDVSEEFKNYDANDELSIIQAMTYTLTQFDSVERVKLRIEGIDQSEMPVNGTPISEGYSRSNGINIVDTNFNGLANSRAVTMYYPKQFNENYYYVPVTQYIDTKNDNYLDSLVKTLIDGPGYNLNMIQVFNNEAMLSEKPILKDGVLRLVFNEYILKDRDKAIIADDVIETLVRSLTEQDLVRAIDIKVENKDQIVNEDGKPYSEPVTEQFINENKKL